MAPESFSVSVVIPAYNCNETIERAVSSVLDQTYPVHEIVIVDDGSSDDTVDTVQKLASNHTQISLVQQSNGGPGKARNTGIRSSTGNWIAFLDADDQWLPDKLMFQKQLVDRNSKLNWVSGRFLRCSGSRSSLSSFNFPNKFANEMMQLDALEALANQSSLWTGTMLMRKSSLDEIELFDDELHGCEDVDLWVRFAIQNRMVGFVNCAIANYTIDQASSLVGLASRKMEKTKLAFYKKLASYVEQTNHFETKNQIKQILANQLGRYIFNMSRTGNVVEARELRQWAALHGMPKLSFQYTWLSFFPSTMIRLTRRIFKFCTSSVADNR